MKSDPIVYSICSSYYQSHTQKWLIFRYIGSCLTIRTPFPCCPELSFSAFFWKLTGSVSVGLSLPHCGEPEAITAPIGPPGGLQYKALLPVSVDLLPSDLYIARSCVASVLTTLPLNAQERVFWAQGDGPVSCLLGKPEGSKSQAPWCESVISVAGSVVQCYPLSTTAASLIQADPQGRNVDRWCPLTERAATVATGLSPDLSPSHLCLPASWTELYLNCTWLGGLGR